MRCGVAIVGMACRYPDADDPHQLWQTVLAGRRAFRRIPPERLRVADYRQQGGDAPDGIHAERAAVLENWTFDRAAFRVPGPTFRATDLTHWLALDVAAAALRDAGVPGGEGLDRDRVGVVIGNSLTGEFSRASLVRLRWPYVRRTVEQVLRDRGNDPEERRELLDELEAAYKLPFPVPGDETLAGGLANTISGRICNHFDFHGAGYTVDGACASSLISVITACTALAQGDLDFALAGGVDLSLDPFELVGFSRLGALARGPMRIYDRKPTGFLPGEGCGLVALTREDDARRMGLNIYARIEGWGMSSDGHGGLTRPERTGQALALRRAYARAGFGLETVGLVEGHGTGTAVGDEVELAVLDEELRGTGRRQFPPVAVGSVKANIGHTKAAAGIAGLIKAVLAVHHGVLPPTTGCEDPHPLLGGPDPVLRAVTEPEPWPELPRRASVNSLGFGGINAHVVVEGGSGPRKPALTALDRLRYAPAPGWEIFPLSGDDARELSGRLARLADTAEGLSGAEFVDAAAELVRRADPTRPRRVAVVASSPAELAERLRAAARQAGADSGSRWDARSGVFTGSGPTARLGLLFPGQGAPSRPDTGLLGRMVPVRDLFAAVPEAKGPDTADTAVVQPAMVAASLAGLRYLEELGVQAEAALGHSLGEISALCWAGAMAPAEAIRLAGDRGSLMADHAEADGGMLAVAAAPEAVEALLRDTDAVIAAVNGPRQVTVAGPRRSLARVREQAARQGMATVPLAVSHAFHSAAMRPALAALARCFAEAPLLPVSRTVVSSVTGAVVEPEADLAGLLTEQILAPVAFAGGVRELARRTDVLLEVGSGAMLSALTAHNTSLPVLSLDVTGGPDQLAAATAALFTACGADPAPWTRHRFSRPIDLDRPRRFLANPCEQAPAGGDAPPSADPAPPAPPASAVPAGPNGAGGSGPSEDPLTTVRGLLAEALELDPQSVGAQDLLLADLHVNSLRIAQIAVDAASRLGRAAPATTAPLATATVAGLAEFVAELPPADSGHDADTKAGVGPWARAFRHRLILDPPDDAAPSGVAYSWTRVAPGHPLTEAISAAFPSGSGAEATVVALPPDTSADGSADPGLTSAETWVTAIRRAAASQGPLLLLHHRGVGAAMARSIAAERPDLPCLVVDVPADADGVRWAAAEAARGITGYTEVTFDEAGRRHLLVTEYQPLPPPDPAAIALGSSDVCLVTGGAKGIGAESALVLGRTTGVRLAVLGRSRPEDDTEVSTNLRRFSEAGITVLYLAADVTDPAAVRHSVAEAEARLGPVTAVMHCAGVNEPGRLETLTPDRLRAASAPKLGGLDAVLAAVDTGRLRLLVAFGSVIARIGVPGESDYALANELMRRRVEEADAALPHCRCLTVEWSQWSGAGMAQRLGAVESLRRQGVAPIPVETGTDILLSLLGAPDLPTTVMVAGRLPRMRTLRYTDESLPLLRFLENPVVHQPGVEVVADAELSLGTDPYLADHALDGVPVLPAVIGLEAMVQAAAAVTGQRVPSAITDTVFERPVTVPAHGTRSVRVAALRRDDGMVETVLRSAETGFAVDHFRALCRFPDSQALPAAPPDTAPPSAAPPDTAPPSARSPYYGELFFHGPRFRNLIGYPLLSGRRCEALVAADRGTEWFSGFHSPHLLLGDPGVRDTFIHLLQGCVPHRRVLPVAVDAVRVHRPDPGGTVVVRAYETSHDADGYCYELTAEDTAGTLLESWHGLRLKDIGPLARVTPWTGELLGPYLARTLDRLLPEAQFDLAVGGPGNGDERPSGRSPALASALLGDGRHAYVARTADGRLVTEEGFVSASHHRGRVLVAVADRPVAVDWEGVAEQLPDNWRDMLGPQAAAVAEQLSAATGEPLHHGFGRAWTCRETLIKLGIDLDAPLVVDRAVDDGWVLLRCGALRIANLVTAVADLPFPVAVSVCVGAPTRTSQVADAGTAVTGAATMPAVPASEVPTERNRTPS